MGIKAGVRVLDTFGRLKESPFISQAKGGSGSIYPTLQPLNYTEAHSTGGVQPSVTTSGITTTSGSLLVAMIFCFGNNIGGTPVTDSKSNTWLAAITSQGNTKGWAAMYYVPNCIGGASHTFTFTPTANDFLVITVFEVPGALTTGVLNGTNFSTVSGTTHDSGNITAGSSAPEIFIGGCAISATAELPTITSTFWGLGSRLLATATTEGCSTAFRVVPASTTDKFTISTGSNQNETIMIAGFIGAT